MEFDRALRHALVVLQGSELRLKGEQRQAIKLLYDGRDVFLWLPTGFGKSICYEVLPFMTDFRRRSQQSGTMNEFRPSLVLVISPMILLTQSTVIIAYVPP